ncbi:MAG TPA: amidohydrolase family protein, partial [Mycobacterium sp.]|nr:amidohydrolase family protein [Mycobacterium sp.]
MDAAKPILFTNVRIWSDGSAFDAEVLVVGDRIDAVSAPGGSLTAPEAEVVDGQGATLMPGLIDGHAHIAFPDVPDYRQWGSIPVEEHVLIYMHNAKTVLDAGFTGAISAGAVKDRLDIVIRNEINAGRIP